MGCGPSQDAAVVAPVVLGVDVWMLAHGVQEAGGGVRVAGSGGGQQCFVALVG